MVTVVHAVQSAERMIRQVCCAFFIVAFISVPAVTTNIKQCNVSISIKSDNGVNNTCELKRATDEIMMYVCNTLQLAMEFVAQEISSSNCIEILLSSGTHSVTKKVTIIAINIILKPLKNGQPNTKVECSNNSSIEFEPGSKFDAVEVMLFKDSDFVSFSGIEFNTCPGIIAFRNITEVNIEQCKFRY